MAISTTSITEAANNGGGTWKDYGTGGGSASNTDVFITSTGSRARKISNGVKGFAFDLGTAGTNLSAQVVGIKWATLAGVGALANRNAATAGVSILVEDTSGNISYWAVDGGDTYTGGFKLSVIDMARGPTRNNGTAATLTAARYVGIEWNETASVGGGDPNCYIDQILYWPAAGIAITGNSTTTVDDLVDTIDNPTNGPYFIFERRAGVVFAKGGKLDFQPDATDMSSDGVTLVQENPVYYDGTNIDSALADISIDEIDGDNLTFTNCSIIMADEDETATSTATRNFDVAGFTGNDFDTDTVVIENIDGTVNLDANLNSYTDTQFVNHGVIAANNATFTNCTFRSGLGVTQTGITSSLAGCRILAPTVAADGGALTLNATISTPTTLSNYDNMTFSQGTNAHHAFTFSTGVTSDITLTGIEFTGFSGTDDVNGSTFEFLATSGSLNLNLVNCTVDGNPATTANIGVDDAAGITVTVVIDPVTTKFTVEDENGTAISNARVLAETADNGGGAGFPFEDAVTITQAAGTATVSHTAHGLATNDYIVIRGAQPDGYNKVAQITSTGANSYTYSVDAGLSSPATGSPVASYAAVSGLTNGSGVAESSKTWPASQGLKGWARKKNASSPFYKDGNINIADASNGSDVVLTLIPDE